MALYIKPDILVRRPYLSRAAEAAREQAIARIPRRLLTQAIQVLNQEGFGKSRWGLPGIFEHNSLTLAGALATAEMGIPVVDGHCLDETGRPTSSFLSPKVPRGAKWQQRATTDPDALIAAWCGIGQYAANKFGVIYDFASRRAARNFHIATGGPLVALDLDKEGGKEFYRVYTSKHGDFPRTPTQITGSGNGIQMLFRLPDGIEIHNTASGIAPQVDIRGKGGQVVAGWSIHPCGQFYRWEPGLAPWEVDLALCPEVLIEAALSSSKITGAKSGTPRKSREPNSGTGTSYVSSGFGWSWDAKLDLIGDGDEREGFDGPIRDVALAWGWENGTDPSDEEFAEFLEIVRGAVLAAPCTDRRNELRYSHDAYLIPRLRDALAYRAERDAEWRAAREAEMVEDDGDDLAGLPEGFTACMEAILEGLHDTDRAVLGAAVAWWKQAGLKADPDKLHAALRAVLEAAPDGPGDYLKRNDAKLRRVIQRARGWAASTDDEDS